MWLQEALELANEEVARRNLEMKEYQSLRMHSIREFQEKQVAEQRHAFIVKQEIAAEKLGEYTRLLLGDLDLSVAILQLLVWSIALL